MKKLGLTICALLCGLYLGACADTGVADNNNNQNFAFSHVSQSRISGDYCNYTTSFLIDNETGVNYIVLNRYGSGSSAAITPRLKADGTLYISK